MLDRIVERTLSNGLKVICLKKTGAPIVSVQIWYRTGSVNERDGIRGISHMLEHMMFRGSAAIAPEEHARRINDVGGHCNAFTAEDVTAFFNNVPRDCFDMMLSLEADRMNALTLSADLLETERKVIIEEYHTYMNNPVTKAFLEFRRQFFAGNPYETSPLGILENIQGISADDCRAYYDLWYSPDNAVAVIVGDIESEDRVFERMEAVLGGVRSRSGGALRPVGQFKAPAASSGMKRMKRRVEFDVPLLVMGFPAPPSSSRDALPLEIIQQVVSQGESSRLYGELVRRQSLAVMAGGMNHYLRHAGMSLFFAVFTPDVPAARIEAALHRQIEIVRNHGITDSELEKVKNATLTHRVFEMYSAEHLCQRIGFSEIVEGNYRLWVERLATLEKLTVDELVDAVRRYWNDEEMHVLHLQPKKISPLLFIAGAAKRLFKKKVTV